MRKKPVVAAVPGRLFADDYSGTGQLAWSNGERGTGKEYWKDDFCGQLRFDSLLSESIVIPDSHVFDGLYFLGTSPSELNAALGRSGLRERQTPAFEIRGREETLSDSLAALLRRPESSMLNAFVFKSLDKRIRHELAAELGRTSETELDRALASAEDVPAGVAAVLEACLCRLDPALDAEALVHPLRDGWRRWLCEEEQISVKKWPVFSTFDIEARITEELSIEGNMHTVVGRDALVEVREVIARGTHRSDISSVLAPLRDGLTTDEPVLNDLELIDVWYSRLRYRALAAMHNCGCALSDRPWLPAVGPGQALARELLRLDNRVQVALPDDVLTALGDMRAEQFVEFVDRQRRPVVRWWETGDIDYLHELSDALAGFARDRKRHPLGIAQTLPAAGSAAGTLAGGGGGPIGGLIGTGAKWALDRRKSDAERVRIRIQETMEQRVSERR